LTLIILYGKMPTFHILKKYFKKMDNLSKTVIKATDILETFLKNDGVLSLNEISKATGLNVATAYRLVSTLVNRGFISHQQSKRTYSLGLKMYDFIYAVRRNLKFIDFAYLSLSKVCKEQNESVYLAVIDRDESLVVEEVGVNEDLRINSPIGKRLKLHCTAGGKVLLASLSEEERNEYYKRNSLQPFTKNTITDVSELEKQLEDVKTEGVAYDKEEYRMGIWATAAPVYNTNGMVIAAAGILALMSHINADSIRRYTTAIKSCTGEISQIISRIS
jgi:IclR family KDG regulon transcriptional repressor